MRAVAARDRALVTRQLGRAPRALHRVVARCPWGNPAVIETLPYDAVGRPFPTLYWATCPSLVAAVSRLESDGGVRRFSRLLEHDEALREAVLAATAVERRRRRVLARRAAAPAHDAGVALGTGIAGVRDPLRLKCLHAHAAHALAHPGYLLGDAVLAAAAPIWSSRACCMVDAPA